jgi:antirestriction protein
MSTTNDTPQVWIACLACYNEGRLHGEWIDATDADAMRELINKLQKPGVCSACSKYFPTFGEFADHQVGTQCGVNGKWVKGTACGHIDNDWAIHDYDGMPTDLGENPDLDKLAELAQAIEEHGDAFRAYMSNVGSEYATAEGFEDSYCGQFDSEKDYAYDYIDSTGMFDNVNSSIQSYFDYDAFARDLFLDGYSFVDGYVFRDC